MYVSVFRAAVFDFSGCFGSFFSMFFGDFGWVFPCVVIVRLCIFIVRI